jgi:hypothetical protein
LAPAVTGPIAWPPLVVNATVSPVIGLPLTSVTVAVAVEVDVPLAVIDAGLNATVTYAARPVVCVNVAVPVAGVAGVESLALIVAVPGVVVDVIFATYVPGLAPAVAAPIVWAPVLVNATVSPETRLPFASVTVAVACVLADPSAVIDAGFNATTTLVAGPGVWVSVAEPAG